MDAKHKVPMWSAVKRGPMKGGRSLGELDSLSEIWGTVLRSEWGGLWGAVPLAQRGSLRPDAESRFIVLRMHS